MKTNEEGSLVFWQMRNRTQPHQLEACFHLGLGKSARVGRVRRETGRGWKAGEFLWFSWPQTPIIIMPNP